MRGSEALPATAALEVEVLPDGQPGALLTVMDTETLGVIAMPDVEGLEILVIFEDPERAEETVRAHGRLLHSGSGRVHAMELELPTRLEDVQADPDILWAGAHPPESVLDELDPSERLFADAWVLRHGGKPERPGEGLDWDEPGRLPPDLPAPPEEPSR